MASRVGDEERLTVADRVPDRIDSHRQITTDVVHDAEEDADDDRAHSRRNQLDEDGQQNAHPHLGENERCHEANEAVRRVEQQYSGS